LNTESHTAPHCDCTPGSLPRNQSQCGAVCDSVFNPFSATQGLRYALRPSILMRNQEVAQ